MAESKRPSSSPEQPTLASWHVPVAAADIAEDGQHFELSADAQVRAAVARLAGVREIERLEASFDVTARPAGALQVVGKVSATVGQNCVVTLDPLTHEIEEEVNLLFAPEPAGEDARSPSDDAAGEPREAQWDAPERLVNGTVDLGALATEFLVLGIDPYPRKPGAVFEPPEGSVRDPGPFAALAGLSKNRDPH
jgi:uncharacterized metal-binding protein YceD (DUF177 family)